MGSSNDFVAKFSQGRLFTTMPYMAFISAACLVMSLLMTLPGLKSVSLGDVYIYRYTLSAPSVYYNAYLFNYCKFTKSVNGTVTEKVCTESTFNYYMDIGNLSATTTAVTVPWSAHKREASTSATNTTYLRQLKRNVLILKVFLIVICLLAFLGLSTNLYLYMKPSYLAGKQYLAFSFLVFGVSTILWVLAVFMIKARINSALSGLATNAYSTGYTLTFQSNANSIISYALLGCLCAGFVLVSVTALATSNTKMVEED